MQQKTLKMQNDRLRKNIWRSLLIMKSATVAELVTVVRGLTSRNCRALLHDLETHGYLSRGLRSGKPVYSHAVDAPSLPEVCSRCDRPFNTKACARKLPLTGKKGKRQTKRQTAAQKQTPEVTHDAA